MNHPYRNTQRVINAETRYTYSGAKKTIERIAKEIGGQILNNGLGIRKEGVPGTGGGTVAITMHAKYPGKYAYVQIAVA